MKILTFLIISLCFATTSTAQELTNFNKKRSEIDQSLMLTLGSWSIANTGLGIYGWSATEDESKYFHQMNVIWSGVNLALAIPGYLKARKAYNKKLTFAESYKEQTKTEKVFLFNSALDLAYITGGFLFKANAGNNPDFHHQFRGYGNSLILQGGFLFLFDLTAVIIHSSHRKNNLDAGLQNVNLNLGLDQVGFTYHF